MNICDSVLIRAAPALSQSLHIQTIYQLLPASCGVPRHQLQTDLSFSPLSFSLRMGSDVACPTVSTSPPVHPHICRDMCSTPQWSRTNDNYDIHPLWRLEIVQLSCPLFIIFPKSVFFFFHWFNILWASNAFLYSVLAKWSHSAMTTGCYFSFSRMVLS